MIDESALSKGKLRNLNALRKPVGPAIADEAFARWLDQSVEAPEANRDAEVISAALWTLVQEGWLSIQWGGCIVRRGRKRAIVEPCED